MAKPKKRVTMKQIAEVAGTSIGTVDRALSNREGISPKTKAHVLKVADELGYTRNTIASALSRQRTVRIGVIYADQPVDFYAYVKQGIDRAAADFADFGVEVEHIRSPLLSPEDQKELLSKLDCCKYDALAINSGGNPTIPYINELVAGGMPVITFNSDSPESDRLFFIGNDARQSGRVAAELMGKLLHGKGSVAVIGNFLNTNTFIDRFGGFCEVIQKDFPGISIYPCAECYSRPDKAYEVVTDLLAQDVQLDGLFSTGYSGTVGMLDAVKNANRRDITTIGYDLSPEIMDALDEGWCTATIYQEPFQQAYQAVRMLKRYLLEGWRPTKKRLFVETKVVFRHNMENYSEEHLKEDPFQ